MPLLGVVDNEEEEDVEKMVMACMMKMVMVTMTTGKWCLARMMMFMTMIMMFMVMMTTRRWCVARIEPESSGLSQTGFGLHSRDRRRHWGLISARHTYVPVRVSTAELHSGSKSYS